MSKEQGRKVVETAVTHQSWNQRDRLRRNLLDAVNSCVGHLKPEELLSLAEKALPAGTTEREDVDYAEAISLLAHIAQKNEQAKKLIGDALYHESNPQTGFLQQILSTFDRSFAEGEADRMAQEIAKQIPLQVQRIKAN